MDRAKGPGPRALCGNHTEPAGGGRRAVAPTLTPLVSTHPPKIAIPLLGGMRLIPRELRRELMRGKRRDSDAIKSTNLASPGCRYEERRELLISCGESC